MPASIRGRLDLLPEEYLRQFCAAPPPLPSVASVRTQTIRLCMPHAPCATLSASADKEAVSAAAPPTLFRHHFSKPYTFLYNYLLAGGMPQQHPRGN